jgi:hypothetical protein
MWLAAECVWLAADCLEQGSVARGAASTAGDEEERGSCVLGAAVMRQDESGVWLAVHVLSVVGTQLFPHRAVS